MCGVFLQNQLVSWYGRWCLKNKTKSVGFLALGCVVFFYFIYKISWFPGVTVCGVLKKIKKISLFPGVKACVFLYKIAWCAGVKVHSGFYKISWFPGVMVCGVFIYKNQLVSWCYGVWCFFKNFIYKISWFPGVTVCGVFFNKISLFPGVKACFFCFFVFYKIAWCAGVKVRSGFYKISWFPGVKLCGCFYKICWFLVLRCALVFTKSICCLVLKCVVVFTKSVDFLVFRCAGFLLYKIGVCSMNAHNTQCLSRDSLLLAVYTVVCSMKAHSAQLPVPGLTFRLLCAQVFVVWKLTALRCLFQDSLSTCCVHRCL